MTAKRKAKSPPEFDLSAIPDSRAELGDDVPYGRVREVWDRACNLRDDEQLPSAMASDNGQTATVYFPIRQPSQAMLQKLGIWLAFKYEGGTISVYDATTTWCLHGAGDCRVEGWVWEGPSMGDENLSGLKNHMQWWSWENEDLHLLWWDGEKLHELKRRECTHGVK